MILSSSKLINLFLKQKNLYKICLLILTIIILFSFFLYSSPLLFLFLCISFLLAWHNVRLAIFLLIASLFISPKINLLTINPESVFVQFYDLFLIAIFFVSLIKIKSKELVFADSALDRPIFFFIIILIISIINGIFSGTVSRSLVALLYLLKIIEYFLIFYVIYFYTRRREDMVFYLTACFLGLLLISIYGIYEHYHPLTKLPYPALYRIYERGFFYGQSNHLGGMLAFFISLILGIIIFTGSWQIRIFLASIIFICICALFWTYSRQAQLNLALSLLTFILLSLKYFKRKLKWIFIFILSVTVIIFLFSPLIQERILSIKEVILSQDIYASSFAYRINKWRLAFADNKGHLLLGTGLGSRHRAFYESQWVMYLSEIGIMGMIIFFWLLISIFKLLISYFVNTQDNLCKGLAIGCLAGLVGLTIQGFVCNVFTVTFIAAPFFVILALILGCVRKMEIVC